MKADARGSFLHARNLKQSGGHLEWGDGIAFPPQVKRFRMLLRDFDRSHATLCRSGAATTQVAIFFIPVLCQWAAISGRPAVHLTRLGTLSKPWERACCPNCWPDVA